MRVAGIDQFAQHIRSDPAIAPHPAKDRLGDNVHTQRDLGSRNVSCFEQDACILPTLRT